MAFGVGQDRDAQAVFLPQDGVGIDVHLVEGNAAAAQLGRQLLAEVATAPPVKAQRISLFQ
jgi:hypothetical protein